MSSEKIAKLVGWLLLIAIVITVVYMFEKFRELILRTQQIYGNLIVLSSVYHIIYVFSIVILVEFLLRKRSSLVGILKIVILIVVALGSFTISIGFEVLLYDCFGNPRDTIVFETELFVGFLLILILIWLNIRWKKKSQELANTTEYALKVQLKKTYWAKFAWMAVISIGLHCFFALLTRRFWIWIWIPFVGPFTLSIPVIPTWWNVVTHVIKNFAGRFRSRIIQINGWVRTRIQIMKENKEMSENAQDGTEVETEKLQRFPLLHQWRGSIRIMQLPIEIKENLNNTTGIWEQTRKYGTWLIDFCKILHIFRSTYFVEFICGNGIQFRIGTYSDSEEKAKLEAEQIRRILSQNFPELELHIEVYQIKNREKILWNSPLMKIELPKPPYRNPIPLIHNIAHLATYGSNSTPVRVLIRYQKAANSDNLGTQRVRKTLRRLVKTGKENSEYIQRIEKSWNEGKLFDVNVYYQVSPGSDSSLSVMSSQGGYLDISGEGIEAKCGKDLVANIENVIGNNARVRILSRLGIRRFLSGNFRFMGSTRVNPVNSGFHFNHNLPIYRAVQDLQSDMVTMDDDVDSNLGNGYGVDNGNGNETDSQSQDKVEPHISDSDLVEIPSQEIYIPDYGKSNINSLNKILRRVLIGSYLGKGNNVTKILAPLYIDKLTQHSLVLGKSGMGKSNFLGYLVNAIRKIDKRITFLILGLKDTSDISLYHPCLPIGRAHTALRIPFRIVLPKEGDTMKEREEMASFISAAFGLLDNADNYILNYMRERDELGLPIPTNFKEFMEGVIDYLIRNPYGESQGDILRAVTEHVKKLRDSRFLEVVEGSEEIPAWFETWLKGGSQEYVNTGNELGFQSIRKTIYLDLHAFSPDEQCFLVLALSQMIRRFSKPEREQRLRRLVVVDEAHIVFSPPDSLDHYSSKNVGQGKISKIADALINEQRKTGTGLIFADQDAQKVVPVIVQQVHNTLIFQVSKVSADALTHDLDRANLYTNLLEYHARYRSSSLKGRRIDATIKTFEHKLKSQPDSIDEILKMYPKIRGKSAARNTESASEIVTEASAFELKLSDLWDHLVALHQMFPILDEDRENLAKIEDFWRKGKKDVIAVINACKKTIAVYHMPLSDKYNHTLMESLRLLEEFLDAIHDVHAEKGKIILTKQQYRRACRWIGRIDLDFHYFYEQMVGAEEEFVEEELASGNFDFDEEENGHALRSSISKHISQPKSHQIQQDSEKPESNDKFQTRSNEQPRNQANDPIDDSAKDPFKKQHHTKNQKGGE